MAEDTETKHNFFPEIGKVADENDNLGQRVSEYVMHGSSRSEVVANAEVRHEWK